MAGVIVASTGQDASGSTEATRQATTCRGGPSHVVLKRSSTGLRPW